MGYIVMVADNYHYMDEDSEYTHGEYDTFEEAEKTCRDLVEENLAKLYEKGMSEDKLWQQYAGFGIDPFIVSCRCPDKGKFSAWDYARSRCKEICSGGA